MEKKQKYGFHEDGRPVDVGEGYELVPAGTVETADMQYLVKHNGKWKQNIEDGDPWPVEDYVLLGPFRRRKAPSGWHKVGEGDRDITRPIWVWRPDVAPKPLCYAGEYSDEQLENRCVTHWQYATLPTPPEMEMSEEEKAFLEAFPAYTASMEDLKKGFIAGYRKGLTQ